MANLAETSPQSPEVSPRASWAVVCQVSNLLSFVERRPAHSFFFAPGCCGRTRQHLGLCAARTGVGTCARATVGNA